MIKKILKWLVAIIILLCIGSLFISNQYHNEHSVMIKAPINVVFDQVNILRNHENWDPWKKSDPTIKLTYNEIAAGEGASYDWDGEGKYTGKGKMTITKSVPNQMVTYDLVFTGHGGATSGHKLEQVGDSVKLTWYFDNDMGYNPMGKYMMKIMGGMMNDMFESGLNDVKKVCESMPAPPATSDVK